MGPRLRLRHADRRLWVMVDVGFRSGGGRLQLAGAAEELLHDAEQLLNPEWLLNAGSAGGAEQPPGFFVDDVTGNENDAAQQLGAMGGEPGMDVGAGDAAGGPHVRDDAAHRLLLQQIERLEPGTRRDHGVAAAFERGTHEGDDGRLIVDDENGRVDHGSAPGLTGRRSVKVAPGASWLFRHMISPPCWRMIP